MTANARRMFSIVCTLAACFSTTMAGAAPARSADRPHVVFVVGTPHYSPEKTLPPLARQLTSNFPFRATVVRPDYDPERNPKGIEGLDVLDDADVAVFFLRFLTLPAEQMAHIERYVASGKPVIGLRTSTHAFIYPEGHELEKWNNGFGRDVLGSRYYLHMTGSTEVRVADGAPRHPILTGFPDGPVTAAGTLYRAKLPGDAKPLLTGKGKPKRTGTVTNMFGTHELAPVETSPVAWTWRNEWGGRVFATTLGHVETFENEWMVRLLINAIHWAADVPVPEASVEVAPIRAGS